MPLATMSSVAPCDVGSSATVPVIVASSSEGFAVATTFSSPGGASGEPNVKPVSVTSAPATCSTAGDTARSVHAREPLTIESYLRLATNAGAGAAAAGPAAAG